jgi:curved DNA-binding protein
VKYKDYYEIMGVSKNATPEEIKKAYRKLSRKYHPDVSKEKDAEERFKEIGEAYEVLRDKEKRAAYDQLGSNWKAGQGFTPPPNWEDQFTQYGDHYSSTDGEPFSDFFESLFGRGGYQRSAHGGSHRARGQDSRAQIQIDLEDAYTGATRSISLSGQSTDEHGRVQVKERTLNVKIPKGIKEGQSIRLQKQGSPGFGGGENGDLYLEVHFKPHPLYKVEGKDVSIELPITPWEAALGEKVKVPTPLGVVDLKLPESANSGSKMRLKGRGLPAKEPGDFYVKLKIVLPKKLSDEEKELYKALKEKAKDFNPRENMGVN